MVAVEVKRKTKTKKGGRDKNNNFDMVGIFVLEVKNRLVNVSVECEC